MKTLHKLKSNFIMVYLDLSERLDNVIVCGDIHGEFRILVYTLEQKHISDAIVIVAGDCGFGFEKLGYYEQLYQRHLHKKLEKLNLLLLMVRGNHDDPAYYNNRVIDYPFMKTLPDYTVVHTHTHNILCVGGAVSIDRNFRISQMAYDRMLGKKRQPSYWPDELMVYDEKELDVLREEEVKIDTVITHTAPSFCPPFIKGNMEHWCASDENLEYDVRKERKDMDKLYQTLKQQGHPLDVWCYGHFHASERMEFERVRFCMLDIMELYSLF